MQEWVKMHYTHFRVETEFVCNMRLNQTLLAGVERLRRAI